MSLSTQTLRTSTIKTVSLENRLESVPSSLEVIINGNDDDSSLRSTNTPSKAAEPSGLDPDDFRRLSISTISGLSDDVRTGRSASRVSHLRYASRSPVPPSTWRAALRLFWERNRGLWLVAMSQFFGALMNVATRLLEADREGLHPFQVLFVRMGVTLIFCCAYMWYAKIPYFPLGKMEVRKLLVLRGLSGFFGIYGMYYSLLYLPLADATVITFLSPALAGYTCYLLFGELFTRIEQIASMVSFLGVILIARPTSFFHLAAAFPGPHTPQVSFNSTAATTTAADHSYGFPTPTPAQRLVAIAISLIGVAGTACVYITLRRIGHRAHPLISVNYFAAWCTLVSFVALSVGSHLPSPISSPSLCFAFPASLKQWGLLLFLGSCGFIMQFMITAGLSHEKSNRATNMVYTNMLFALLFDRWVFGTIPGVWSLLGSGLILGSAIYVALQKGSEDGRGSGQEADMGLLSDEERAMVNEFGSVVDSDGGGESQGLQLMEINVWDHDEEREQSVAYGENNR